MHPDNPRIDPLFRRRPRRRFVVLPVLLAFLAPIAVSCATLERDGNSWSTARRDPTNQAPDPATTPEAVLQVYAARTYGWRGALGVHTWISVKRSGAPTYKRYEVIGWGVDRGVPAVRVDRMGPDNYWFGSHPDILVDRRGEGVDELIDKVEAAVADYPYPTSYRTWPGPNSNTFTAHVARAVPELRLDLPSTAVGKDFLPDGAIFAAAPSGTGFQFSLFGLLGLLVAAEEGIEINVLGLTLGIDFNDGALKLPGLGRLGGGQVNKPAT